MLQQFHVFLRAVAAHHRPVLFWGGLLSTHLLRRIDLRGGEDDSAVQCSAVGDKIRRYYRGGGGKTIGRANKLAPRRKYWSTRRRRRRRRRNRRRRSEVK